ncbi:NADP-dependent oxidoreductase [Streptomyces sp. WM6378]|uniref:NADP-dependent oxidoreductase n=1 Tax=Streptomyces sp. WM6378 TaxID=1415557 RepID=UPI0006ADA1BA|nr:NADP-dependent oxidoreductase [Streptomyces sp. WM6378]KOU45172.1 NADPH:quinone reductase [Streptomyces sp. WM6378]
MSQTMRAISPLRWGGPEVLAEIETERPEPGPAEILVRVHAAGVNPADWKVRASGGLAVMGTPPILGWDVSGTVEAVGFGVTLYRPGDEVFGMPRFPHQAGAYAEYVTAPARHFVPKPAGIDHIQAAALPLASLTAYQSLVETARLAAGQRVLIHAAAGGVGHLAVQIAKARGAYVIGTASAAKHDFVRGLGADEVIDYTAVDFTEAVRDVDVVLDPIGDAYGSRSLKVLRRGGVLVSIASPDEDELLAEAAELGIRAGFTLVEADYAGMRAIAALVEEGRLRAEIDSVFELTDAAKAHEYGERGRTQGKLVLRVV